MGLTDYEKVWEKNRQAGAKALRDGQLGQAEEHYRTAVVLSELLWPKTERHAHSLNAMGSVYVAKNQAIDALPFLERALEILSEIRGPSDPSLIPVLDDYAKALRKAQRHATAENLERRITALKRRLRQEE